VHTSRDINAVTKCKVGLSTAILKGQPPYAAVLEELLSWIGNTVDEMDEWQGVPLIVLCLTICWYYLNWKGEIYLAVITTQCSKNWLK